MKIKLCENCRYVGVGKNTDGDKMVYCQVLYLPATEVRCDLTRCGHEARWFCNKETK